MEIKELERDEIERVRDIDRREVIEGVYYHRDGRLVLVPERHDVVGWPPGALEEHISSLRACLDQGGVIFGAFSEDGRLQGIAAVGDRFFGTAADRLQLVFLHVSDGARGQGLGSRLFAMAAHRAQACGARVLYVSATPSENTVDFYLGRGCRVADEVDAELFALEPEDIHLEYVLSLPG